MKYFLCVLFFGLFLASCTTIQNTTPPSKKPTFIPSASEGSGVLEPSSINDIHVNLTESYRYLDSENRAFESGSFGDIISHTPYTIVYFYPKDGTPNCTIQALDFSLMKEDFKKLGYEIIGVSSDSVDSHLAFAERNELRIKLLEDHSGSLLTQFGNKWELKEYGNGKDLSDIRRSTFIIDKDGKPLYAFRDIAAKWHAKRIYELISSKK